MKENKIEKLDSKIKELKQKKNELINQTRYQSNVQYRKDRARRLIETGALAEKYFELLNLSIDEREEIFKMFASFVNANKPMKYKK